MIVLKYAQTLTSAIPALVDQAIAWQVMDMDVMVKLHIIVCLHASIPACD
jgi:hypothetical protein